MQEKQLFTITDLGGGDGGKGGVVHKVCTEKQAHTVIKVGGAQGSHGVRTSFGQSHNFSQFGCGTFEGTRTHMSEIMLVEPYLLLEEAQRLKFEWGIHNIFDYLTIDQTALCITPYHTIASRLREMSRTHNPKGTVGIGAGEAILDAESHPLTAIFAKDLGQPHLRKKIETIREQKIADLLPLITANHFLPEDIVCAKSNIELLYENDFVDRILERFNTLATSAKIVPSEYLKKHILSRPGTVVVEASHGILTDRYHGFHPHTTKVRTLPQETLRMLEQANYDGEIFKLGVTRGYQIRHGAGPMVTESPELTDTLLPGSHKDENRWQGKVRVGPLDLIALRYAIEVCGGPSFFDGLAISWFDQIQTVGKWDVCTAYRNIDDPLYFSTDGSIKVRRGSGDQQLAYQQKLGERLSQCTPEVYSYDVQGKSQEELIELCSQTLLEKLGVPVRMISFGPTEKDKVCL